MKTKHILFAALALLAGLVIVLIVVRARRPSHPLATIQVVDPTGHPVAGAVITPDGLRPKHSGSHYAWRQDPKPNPVVTDKDGLAVVPYPRFTDERLETGEISFRVEHPDFCSDRPFRTVNQAPTANAPVLEKIFYSAKVLLRNVQVRPAPVVLKPGAIIEVSGYLEDTNSLASPVYVQVAELWDTRTNVWRQLEPKRLTCRTIPEGERVLRLVHVPPGKLAWFSDPVSFHAVGGQTNRFHLRLSPSRRLMGRLDDSVPRPVANGVVVLDIANRSASQKNTITWHTWSEIDTNGTFRLEGLPPGKVEIVALCDGYVSRDGKSKTPGSIRNPQKFLLEEQEFTVDLAMEPTATFELSAVDESGQPIEGAEVSFWPNVIWDGRISTVFCTDLYQTLGMLTGPTGPSSWRRSYPNRYSGKTGRDGVAFVTNLPSSDLDFAVRHPNLELPVVQTRGRSSRTRSVNLIPAETVRQTVTLRPHGLDHVEHQRQP